MTAHDGHGALRCRRPRIAATRVSFSHGSGHCVKIVENIRNLAGAEIGKALIQDE